MIEKNHQITFSFFFTNISDLIVYMSTETSLYYKKTLELEPGHTNAKYSLGVFYFNKGADANNEANTYDFNDPQYNAKYDAKITESKDNFKKAVGYLENASKEEPKDIQILEALKSAYGKAGMVDEFKATKAKITELKG